MVYGAQLKLGDYVEILPGVYDDSMPDNRRDGLVVELLNHDRGRFGDDYDQLNIMFHNGRILKFHKSQVKIISKPD